MVHMMVCTKSNNRPISRVLPSLPRCHGGSLPLPVGAHGLHLHPVLADPTPRRPIQQQQSSWVSASLPEGKGSFFCALPGGSCPPSTRGQPLQGQDRNPGTCRKR